MNQQPYDEREMLIRNRVFKHGFIFLIALLIFDFLLKSQEIALAQGLWNNLVYIMAALAFVVIEFNLRGVYFSPKDNPKQMLFIIAFYNVGVGVFTFMRIRHIREIPFIEEGQLTWSGALTITIALAMFVSLFVAARAIIVIRNNRNLEEEDNT